MATCTVYHNRPGAGPGRMAAQVALDDIQQLQPLWNITMDWDADRSVYTATPSPGATVTGDGLQTIVEPQFQGQGYLFSSTA